MRKGRFLLIFLSAFGLLLVLWRALDAGAWFTEMMLAAASVLGPMTHGWILQPAAEAGQRPVWVHGTARVDLQIQFDALSVGIVPLLALFVATPGLRLAPRLRRMALGVMICFVIDTTIIVLFPLLVFYKNDFTDVAGTFLGLVGFVGAPAIVWFALVFSELRQWLPRFR